MLVLNLGVLKVYSLIAGNISVAVSLNDLRDSASIFFKWNYVILYRILSQLFVAFVPGSMSLFLLNHKRFFGVILLGVQVNNAIAMSCVVYFFLTLCHILSDFIRGAAKKRRRCCESWAGGGGRRRRKRIEVKFIGSKKVKRSSSAREVKVELPKNIDLCVSNLEEKRREKGRKMIEMDGYQMGMNCLSKGPFCR